MILWLLKKSTLTNNVECSQEVFGSLVTLETFHSMCHIQKKNYVCALHIELFLYENK